MIKIDNTFPNRLIVCGLNEDNLVPFIKGLVEHAWMEHDVPGGMRVVNQGRKLTLEMLPKDCKPQEIAESTAKKGLLMIERIGAVNIFLKVWVNRATGTNPQIKVDIDRFAYEKDGNNLVRVVNGAIGEI